MFVTGLPTQYLSLRYAKASRPGWLDLMTNSNSNWLTATEAAAYLKVEPRTLLGWARAGKVQGFTLSGIKRHVWRFRQVDLDAMLIGPAVLKTGGKIETSTVQ